MSKADGPAAVFAALGDSTRLDLIATLGDGRPRSLSALTADYTLTRQGVAKHLRVLEDAGLVSRLRVGRESRFAVRPERLAQAADYLQAASARWDAALDRLRAHVESG